VSDGGPALLEVIDLSGKVLYTQKVLTVSGLNFIELNQSALGGYRGIAICRLEMAGGVGLIKVLFQ
jgi:hypothetical protein